MHYSFIPRTVYGLGEQHVRHHDGRLGPTREGRMPEGRTARHGTARPATSFKVPSAQPPSPVLQACSPSCVPSGHMRYSTPCRLPST